MSHVAWPEIFGFHVVRGNAAHRPEILGGRTTVEYRAKVKLHGRCGAVQVRGDKVFSQSREEMLGPDTDNHQMRSFAKWVDAHREQWKVCIGSRSSLIVFGWCGPGINKGVAVNKIPEKVFAVFAAAEMPLDDDSALIVDPVALAEIVRPVGEARVIPWYTDSIPIPMLESPEVVQPILDGIVEDVRRVEVCDPWVHDEFGIDVVGEGLVYYPIHLGWRGFSDLAFKAKGEKHAVVAQRAPVQIDPEVAASVDAYAAMVLTPARLEQGARAAARGELVFEKRLMGPFIAWITGDVEKETEAERSASGLTWKQVQRAVSDRARAWYLANAEKVG